MYVNKACKQTFTNPNGFNPRYWGKSFWQVLHEIAWNFPIINNDRYSSTSNENLRYKYKIFFKTIASVLPCYICCQHYYKYITKGPINCRLTNEVFDNRQTLTKWLFNVHNCVRKGLKHKIIFKTYKEIQHLYINKNYWNKYGNKSLYYIIWNFPVKKTTKKQKLDFIQFFKQLQYVIPNEYSKTKYKKNYNLWNDVINIYNISRKNLIVFVLKVLDVELSKVCKKYIVNKRVN